MTSLRVICGLGPPPIKNPGYAYDSGAGTPKPCKKLSVKYLLISKKTSALGLAVQNN